MDKLGNVLSLKQLDPAQFKLIYGMHTLYFANQAIGFVSHLFAELDIWRVLVDIIIQGSPMPEVCVHEVVCMFEEP